MPKAPSRGGKTRMATTTPKLMASAPAAEPRMPKRMAIQRMAINRKEILVISKSWTEHYPENADQGKDLADCLSHCGHACGTVFGGGHGADGRGQTECASHPGKEMDEQKGSDPDYSNAVSDEPNHH